MGSYTLGLYGKQAHESLYKSKNSQIHSAHLTAATFLSLPVKRLRKSNSKPLKKLSIGMRCEYTRLVEARILITALKSSGG